MYFTFLFLFSVCISPICTFFSLPLNGHGMVVDGSVGSGSGIVKGVSSVWLVEGFPMLCLCLDPVRRSDLGIVFGFKSFKYVLTYGGVCLASGDPLLLTGYSNPISN